MSDNIKVVVKVRPLISREIEEKLSYQWRVKNNTLYQLDSNGRDYSQAFTFDQVYDENTKTSDVYNDIAKPIVEAATAGFNGTIFAYGQTSSGKTYTMTGTEKSPGIIPLAVLNLFEIIKNIPDRDFLVRVSYIEIYNETLKDLLNVDKDNIKIHETQQGIKVDATEKPTSSPEEVLEVMKEGEANRQTGATNMNEKSSRSHSIFQITIESREHVEGEEQAGCVNVSQLNLVDLAGSERAGQTGATGIRFKEGTHINKSLSALALVIKQLSEDPKKFANYRDSKLTRILQNSLGGNAKTGIICAVTPAAIDETISTLQFANRAKAIKNTPEVNAVATDATMIQSLTKQLSKLQSKLESKKNLEQDNYNLQKQIASMQRLILNGFGQTRSEDIVGGARRKLQQPRRKTISTLHSIEEDTTMNVPKFCTPIVKYNPMLIPSASDFVPIQNPNRLASLPEEPAGRLVTPPPNDRRVNFNEEIIEIDSDDDECSNTQTCSPYHKCYVSSKTPPCILRKNAKQAEKDLKDIVKLTEIEKMYTPSVIELLEKQEKDASIISRLQDEVETLNKISIEKDLEMNKLKSKIKQTEEEVRSINSAKLELETRCVEYNTKITDWEVIYDTLKNKARLREEELLSLLEEQKLHTRSADIGKISAKLLEKEITHFMDMSKDISLVNSDNESSIVTPNDDEPSSQINELITDMQSQLTLRNETIIELEANLEAQKQRIVFLENSSQELQDMVNSCKENLSCFEKENVLLKTTVDSLNSTIKSQKQNLEIAQNDMASYNSLIQELQIKLTKKESFVDVNLLNDAALENMIANEQKFIANNENMKNIIHSFRIVLDTRNKEINQLKSIQNKDDSAAFTHLKHELEAKTKDIEQLNIEVKKLKDQVKENVATIDKLICEKSNLVALERELQNKLTSIEERCLELEKLNEQYTTCIDNLKENNENLTLNLSDKTNMQEELLKEIQSITNKIICLEDDVRTKDSIIASLNKEEDHARENLLKAKTAIKKLHEIFSILTGDIMEVPEIIDNFVTIFTTMSHSLNNLENIAINVVEQKDVAVKNSLEMKEELAKTINNHKIELSVLHLQIENHVNTENKYITERNNLLEKVTELSGQLSKIHNEIDQKTEEHSTLSTKLKTMEEQKDSLISFMIEKESDFVSKIENYKKEIDDLNVLLLSKQENIDNLSLNLTESENKLQDKCIEIKTLENKFISVKEEKDQIINSIFKRVCNVIDHFNIENSLFCANDTTKSEMCEQIMFILDKIANHISLMNLKNENTENGFDGILTEAKNEIKLLTQENLELINKLAQIQSENDTLSSELQKYQTDHKSFRSDLIVSQELLDQLKKELKEKSIEMGKMEIKALEWKDQFMNLDILMKQEMQHLQNENEKLKARGLELRNDTQLQIDSYSDLEIDNALVKQDSKCIKTMSNLISNAETISPPSLLTICCDKIVQFIQPKENDSNSEPISSTDLNYFTHSTDDPTKTCMCIELSSDLKLAHEENLKLKDILKQLELLNQALIKDQEEVRKEIQLLLEPAQELQKKVASHKTNLCILTATTYAENKSLKSQVKGLQHHHNRFHTVCQRDIPAFKMQLVELMTILKGDPALFDAQNVFKRFSLPDVLDSNSTLPNFKNESTLDGDLLMLDTNITLATSADNTLLGFDQTCLDITQTMYNEASCQTIDPNIACSRRELLQSDNQNLYDKLKILTEENMQLREQIKKYSKNEESKVDVQCSPIKAHGYGEISEYLEKENTLRFAKETLEKELQILSQELIEVKAQKHDFENKYNNLLLEVPSTDALVCKFSALDKDYNCKVNEVSKLTNMLHNKNDELKSLLEENNSLSTQLMENISEADDLNSEIDSLKKINIELTDKCFKLESKESKQQTGSNICSQCALKDEVIQSFKNKSISKIHSKLNRSLSDSDTASRYNKICTLQSELHAGREDCKELTEEVATIKNHLENSNMSMDLDENSDDSNIFSLAKEFEALSPQHAKCNMPDITEERPLDIYMIDKIDCFKFYLEKTDIQKESLNRDMKIIDLMKRFYNNLIIKHGNEVENLVNKLRDQEESKTQLETQIKIITSENVAIKEELKGLSTNIHTNVLSEIKHNIDIINNVITVDMDTDTHTKIVNIFKEKVLNLIDFEFELSSSVKIFELIVENIFSKHQKDLTLIMEKYTKIQNYVENVTSELNSVNKNVEHMKSQLCEKESEYNLLKAQKEKIHEINNAVTLDIIKKEQNLNNIITDGYKKLIELKIINPSDINLMNPFTENIKLLIENVINQYENNQAKENEINKLIQEVKNSKNLMIEIENNVEELKIQKKELQDKITNITSELADKENKLQTVNALHVDLKSVYDRKVEENAANLSLTQKLTEEIKILKDTVGKNETQMHTLTEKEEKIAELLNTVKDLQEDNDNLKSVHKMILNEKETYANELEKSGETIRCNNIELDKLTSDILVLRESLKENMSIIDHLKLEAKALLQENLQLKEKFDEKNRDCSRLETNIKTHEKTAEIQSRMIMRLQKQKEEEDSTKNKKLEELSEKCSTLQKECEVLQNTIDTSKSEIENLKLTKESLESRVSELEATIEAAHAHAHADHPRLSMDAISDTSRRRRQSLYDSKRLFSEDKHHFEEHAQIQAVFDERGQLDDLFMDVEDDNSNRSSPIRLSRGRESLLSRSIQSDKDENPPSRPGSVQATRRRRQSTHDLRRSVPRLTPDPPDYSSNNVIDELNMKSFEISGNSGNDSEIYQLRNRLASCQQELEELKEKYRELDEECETCAEYLRERDGQCLRLKREKITLEQLVTELKEKLQSCNVNEMQQESKGSFVDASVNTDEDWTNLHSVVVDRMSYDAEVEKNKRFTKIIEELRFKKQDLKNTISKMQKALEKNSAKDNKELEATKKELKSCKLELEELKAKYKELDEECEMCAEYLKERDEQCRKLKEAKSVLEAKLQKIQEDNGSITRSVRKKRQDVHDLNRGSASDASDAFTETSDDFLSYQVERDDSSIRTADDSHTREIKHLKMTIEKLSHQKATLEQRLKAAPATAAAQPVFVATGSAIVQNQQLTDVMKENQKLKKINAKLVNICKKRGKSSEANRENEDPAERG